MTKIDQNPFQMKIHEYRVIGRALPTEKLPEPKIYRMKLFAKNSVMAKSRFWYFMNKINKIKKSKGETLSVSLLSDKSADKVKNFAIWLRYDSRTGTHNMYKEFRATTRCGAISQLYSDMTGRHRALHSSIQIMRIAEIQPSMCKRLNIIQFQKRHLKFPAIRKIPIKEKKYRQTFSACRSLTFKK